MPSVSAKQHRAMEAAAHGHSTLGIPKRVGEEFVAKDATAGHAAGILYVAPDGDVLLLRRSNTEPNYAGHWNLPGGMAEPGETPKQTALREANEETGGAAPPGALRPLDQRITPTGTVFYTFAKPTDVKFAPQLDDESSGYCWAPLDALPQPVHPAVLQTLRERVGAGPVDGAADMTPEDWSSLRENFAKWTREEEQESEHTEDAALATDSIALDKASVRRDDVDGHLHVERTPISKAMINPYWGNEIPEAEALGLDPQKTYDLLRDPEELEKAAHTFAGKPLLHKHTPVNADDHPKDVVVGSVGDEVSWDKPYLTAPLHVWDGDTIRAIESGKQKELSCGYRYRADMTPGTYEGQHYDGVMRDIVGNHVALVIEGRCGPSVAVMDSDPFAVYWSRLERALLQL